MVVEPTYFTKVTVDECNSPNYSYPYASNNDYYGDDGKRVAFTTLFVHLQESDVGVYY